MARDTFRHARIERWVHYGLIITFTALITKAYMSWFRSHLRIMKGGKTGQGDASDQTAQCLGCGDCVPDTGRNTGVTICERCTADYLDLHNLH